MEATNETADVHGAQDRPNVVCKTRRLLDVVQTDDGQVGGHLTIGYVEFRDQRAEKMVAAELMLRVRLAAPRLPLDTRGEWGWTVMLQRL